MSDQRRLTIDRIEQATSVIDPVFLNSPQFDCDALSADLGCQLTLKIETMNPIRCFKGRGADWLVSEAARRGEGRVMFCASAGNFGQAMAYAGTRHGCSVTVYAAETANPLKVQRMRALGANVRLFGADFDAAKTEARRVAEALGARFVEDSRDVETAEGAGTIGLDLVSALDEPVDDVIVPLGNGSMLIGIATAIRALSPDTRIVAVQASGAPAMTETLRTGRIVKTRTADTIADGIAVRVPVPEAVSDMTGLVDDALLVDDSAITAAMRRLYTSAGLVTEPAGAIGVAAVAEHPARFEGRRVATVICGANATPEQLSGWGVV